MSGSPPDVQLTVRESRVVRTAWTIGACGASESWVTVTTVPALALRAASRVRTPRALSWFGARG